MRKLIAISVITFTAIFAPTSYASDPCKVVMCMFGVMKGSGVVSGCRSSVNSYFDIRKYGARGGFLPGATKNSRGKLLNSCPSAGYAAKKINDKFGRSFGL